MLCLFRKHRYEHIGNFSEYDRRGLYQCSNCKKIVMSLPSEFFDKQTKKGKFRLEDGIYVP